MERNYTTGGFMRDAAYSAYLHGLLLEYDTKFGRAESLKVNLTEILPEHSGKFGTKLISFSEDGKSITINLEQYQLRNNKNRITSTPTPQEVFQTLRFVLNRAIEEYKEKFPENDADENDPK